MQSHATLAATRIENAFHGSKSSSPWHWCEGERERANELLKYAAKAGRGWTRKRRGDWLVKDGAINYSMTYKVGAAEWNGMVLLEAAHQCCSCFAYAKSIISFKNGFTVVTLTIYLIRGKNTNRLLPHTYPGGQIKNSENYHPSSKGWQLRRWQDVGCCRPQATTTRTRQLQSIGRVEANITRHIVTCQNVSRDGITRGP